MLVRVILWRSVPLVTHVNPLNCKISAHAFSDSVVSFFVAAAELLLALDLKTIVRMAWPKEVRSHGRCAYLLLVKSTQLKLFITSKVFV